ncbi:signal transduction protein [Moorella sp. E306M]|uniref:signal transduction protein n=1 Tax=Moorella sp. E306M TaxID=2572683 RepID=UPI0010FFB6D4|nr:signal transduction protein [Moorella sp. E306M]GEA17483.1 hypothetical protein E306M_06170 [Moorella sp. E306M]
MPIADLRNHAYEPTEWEDRVVDQVSGEVLVEGTPVNEVNLNNIESALLLAHLDIGSLAGCMAALVRSLLSELDKYKRQRFIQGQATITGSGGEYFVDSEPFVTVSLPTDALAQLNAPNYDVLITPISASDWGAIGELIVYDKAQNGFKVKMTGSAESVTFIWTIINPSIR